MAIILLGALFLFQAILHFLGWSRLLSLKHREAANRESFQRGLVFPCALLGTGWIVLGVTHRTADQQNSLRFCLLLVLISLIPVILLVLNRRKHRL